jgi:hypothetical protein
MKQQPGCALRATPDMNEALIIDPVAHAGDQQRQHDEAHAAGMQRWAEIQRAQETGEHDTPPEWQRLRRVCIRLPEGADESIVERLMMAISQKLADSEVLGSGSVDIDDDVLTLDRIGLFGDGRVYFSGNTPSSETVFDRNFAGYTVEELRAVITTCTKRSLGKRPPIGNDDAPTQRQQLEAVLADFECTLITEEVSE